MSLLKLDDDKELILDTEGHYHDWNSTKRPLKEQSSTFVLCLSKMLRFRRSLPVLVVVFATLVSLFVIYRRSPNLTESVRVEENLSHMDGAFSSEIPVPDATPEYLKLDNYVLGPPTIHFRDSLRNDTKYITSWLDAGFTNDVITIGNLIYLAIITSRVPVIPRFTSHIDADGLAITFSEVFDLQYLSQALRMPVFEWHQIKDLALAEDLGEKDEIGCWNVWETVNVFADKPRHSYTPETLNLDISYTRAPAWVKLIPGYEHDSHSTFWSLARLAFSDTRKDTLAHPVDNPTLPSERHSVVLPPDEQMLCYDYLFYVCGVQPFEYDYELSPMWNFVVKHFRWTKALEEMAEGYLRRTMNVPEGEPIPPYITIHARRGDFGGWCSDVPRDLCFAPLSAFARRVSEVQQELRDTRGIEATHVIMTGDERDPAWWYSVQEIGWLRLDYEATRTVELYGRWYPVILDAVIQSKSIGFVGTDRSTFSILARRRVMDWNNGVIRMVLWGRPDADAH